MSLPTLSQGVYIVKISHEEKQQLFKIALQ